MSIQSPAGDSRTLAMTAALLAIFTSILASNLPTPLYAVWQARWGFSSTALTGVFAIYVLGVVSMLLTIGTLSDRLGRRQVLIPGLLFIGGGAVMFLLADGINSLAIARLLTGVGTGLVTGAASASVMELEPNGNWNRAAALTAVFFTGGAFAGPALGSLALHLKVGQDIWPFFTVIAMTLVTIALLLKAPWPANIGQRHSDFRWRHWRPTPVTVPRELLGVFAFCAAAICLAWSTGSLYASLGPSLARELVGIDNRALAGLFAAAWQLLAGCSQFGCQHQPQNRLLVAGPMLLVIGLLCMAGAVIWSSPLLLSLATLGTAVGAGATGVVAVSSINQMAPPSQRGGISSAFYLMAYLTMASVVLGVGLVSDLAGFGNTVIGFTLIISAAAVSLVVVAVRTGRTALW
ncbi:MAG: MFS transporter [Halopseudomonas yangmingensis]